MMLAIRTVAILGLALFVIPLGIGRALVGGRDIKCLLLGGLFASFCVFEALAMIFHVAMGSLRLMTGLWCVLCGGLAIWGYRARKEDRTSRTLKKAEESWDQTQKLLLLFAVFLIALQTMNTVFNTYYGNWDDETYCGTAVTSWYTDTVNRYAPSTGVLQRPFYNDKYVIASWPVYSSMLAVLTGVHPAIIFRTILPLFEIPFAYWIAYQLLRVFFPESRKKALLGLIYFQVFTLMAAESMSGTSSEWWLLVNGWTGKALTASIMTPLILWLLIRLDQCEGTEREKFWRVLLAVSWACCFVSASLFFVAPLELCLWGSFNLLRTRRWTELPRYILCGLPLGFCALITLL